MQAETGFELDDSAPPLRVSGFICLIFGVLSFLCLLGQPLLVLPLIAIIFGVFALRRSGGQTPVGTRPAMVGLVLAVGFGACGMFLPWMKTRTLGSQAEQFSRYYLEVVARGQDEFAMELRKDYVNRLPTTMSLKEHYTISEDAARRLAEFREDSMNTMIRKRGPNADWILDRPTRVYYSYQREHAEVVWIDPTGETSAKIQMFLEYLVSPDGEGQWHVDVVQSYREPIVAENIL
jgi:hypothetical protein